MIKAKSMRNGLAGAAPENAELAFSGDIAATGETIFELIRCRYASMFSVFCQRVRPSKEWAPAPNPK
jgi:hypothetical protein